MSSSAGPEARARARAVVDRLRAGSPETLELDGIELGAALEQAVFAAIRNGVRGRASRLSGLKGLLRVFRAALLGFGARYPSGRGGVAVLVQVPIHQHLFESVGLELSNRGIGPTVVLGADAAALRPLRPEIDLRRQLATRWVPRLLAHAARVEGAAIRPPRHDPLDLDSGLLHLAQTALPRIALTAAQLESVLTRVQPSALVAFNEVGLWARIAPAVARHLGIPSIDLPHAEAADPHAAQGLAYDAIGAYGPRSAALLRSAGISAEKIHVVGPIRYDSLVRVLRRAHMPEAANNRVIYASQPVKRAIPGLSLESKRLTLEAAAAAAEVIGPAELLVVRHPTEELELLECLVRDHADTPGVTLRLEAERDLHELLPGASLLITASSQSVFDAALAGVPAITVHTTTGSPPVPYAEEGFATQVTDAASARKAASALTDPRTRALALRRSQAALQDRYGEIDGGASRRAAVLIETVVRSTAPRTTQRRWGH